MFDGILVLERIANTKNRAYGASHRLNHHSVFLAILLELTKMRTELHRHAHLRKKLLQGAIIAQTMFTRYSHRWNS